MVLDITKMNIHIIKREIFFIFSNHLMNKQDGKKKKKIRLIMYCIIVGALFLTSLCVVALNVTKRCHISFFFFCSLRNACTRTLCLVASYKQGTTRNTHTNTLTERRCCQYGSFPLLVF